MISRYFKQLNLRLKRLYTIKSAEIDRQAVIRDVIREEDISAGYFLVLNIANLIALMGLVLNSAPVIIGAMLISPLMGPILNTGFAFATGDMEIGRKAIRKISLSLVATIICAAAVTFVSPLKDITPEIIARTRPNLYDLFIAFLAGIVGASAMCTKKNYMTIVTGVAIATAVIPPISVTGFGIGTGNFRICAGGFLLFFTNFVAIIISTCIVFYVYGFRPSAENGADVSYMRNRVVFLAGLLVLISIPLAYTLRSSIIQVKLRNEIQTTLKHEFDREGQSRLSSFTFRNGEDGKIEIAAQIHTISYLKETEIRKSEEYFRNQLKSEVMLELEQVRVQPGGLREETAKPSLEPAKPAIAPPLGQQKAPAEAHKAAANELVSTIKEMRDKVEAMLKPSTVEEMSVESARSSQLVTINLNIRRDTPLSTEQKAALERILADELDTPVNLRVKYIPFIPPLVFREGDASLSEDMKRALLLVKELYRMEPSLSLTIQTFPGSRNNRLNGSRLARERSAAISRFLIENYHLPADRIRTVMKRSSGNGTSKALLSVTLPR